MLSRLLRKNNEATPAYVRKPLFDAEMKAFYGRLRRALPKCYLFPDVALAAMLTPAASDPRQNRAQQLQLNGRIVDFAVYDARLNLLCVIELTRPALAEPDPVSNADLLAAAGIKRFCWNAQQLPTAEQILRSLVEFSSLQAPPANGPVSQLAAIPLPLAPATRMFSLNVPALEALAPGRHLQTLYPHIWERICLFCSEPAHMEQYIGSLSLQDRSGKRAGFPVDVLSEIAAIQAANRPFLPIETPSRFGASWNEMFADR